MLRVRTGPECPEDNLRELMCDSNPNCGIAREEKKRGRRQFPRRATWSLSSVDWESTHSVSSSKPSVGQTLRAFPTHTNDIVCGVLPPHSTTEQISLNK